MSNQQLALQFLLQLAVILLACRVVGGLMPRIGQPKVIGEMIAGILLGPSLLGLFAPSVQSALFPPESLGVLSAVSQIGLVLYMFVVGTHLQTDFIRQAFRGAMLISLAGVVVPFVLGAALASFLYADGRFFAPNVSSWQSMMYLGAAMSVTAFPVLARIIQERGIARNGARHAGARGGRHRRCDRVVPAGVVLVSLNPRASTLWGSSARTRVFARIRGRRALMPRDAGWYAKCSAAGSSRWRQDGARAAVFRVLGAVHAARPAVVEPSCCGSRRRDSVASVGKAVGVLGRGSPGRPPEPRSDGDRRADERARADGAHHAEHRSRARADHADLFTVMVVMTLVTTMAAGPLFEWAWRGSREVPDLRRQGALIALTLAVPGKQALAAASQDLRPQSVLHAQARRCRLASGRR